MLILLPSGHGPFSHLFDGRFIPRVLPDTKWKVSHTRHVCPTSTPEPFLTLSSSPTLIPCTQHEDASVMMFHHLIDENDLREEMEKYGLEDIDVTFIMELIAGPIHSELASSQSSPVGPLISANII